MIDSQYDIELRRLYQRVFDQTLTSSNLDSDKLLESKKLFNYDEQTSVYSTRKFHLTALLGGLPFSTYLQQYVVNIQQQIDQILQTEHRYWVKPNRLAVEYFVSKWANNEILKPNQHDQVKSLIVCSKIKPFDLVINGLQFHKDGCMVLRGYDSNNIRGIRSMAISRLDWLPRRQSSWAHIPIGRILYPLTPLKYSALTELCKSIISSSPVVENINKITYLHEYQWYMEDYCPIFSKELL